MRKQAMLVLLFLVLLPLPVLAQTAKDTATKEYTILSPWGLVITFSALVIGYGAGWIVKKKR